MESSKVLFRIIDPLFGKNNVYRYQAKQTISLGPVAVATFAESRLPWISAQVISDNNYTGGPKNKNGLPDHLALQKMHKADILGVSASISNSAPRAIDTIKEYVAMPVEFRPKAIIVGGWDAGDKPEAYLNAGATVVVHGEAEPTLIPLLTAVRDSTSLKDIPGISYMENGQMVRNGPDFLSVSSEEMDNLPDPDFSRVSYADMKVYPLNFTRGCDGKCRFCRVKVKPRSISPERFVRQIMKLYHEGITNIFVVDDRAEQNQQGFIVWLKDLAKFRKENKAGNLTLTTQNRLSLASYPEILQLMWDAGIRNVAIGYESPIPEELAAMKKPINPGKMLAWTKVWKRFGFLIHMMMIFGYPLPPGLEPFEMNIKERFVAFDNFIRLADPATLQVLIYTPIPGTEDWKYLNEGKRVSQEIGFEFLDGLHLCFKPDSGIDPLELQRGAINLMEKFYGSYFWKLGWIALIPQALKWLGTTLAMPFIFTAILPFKRFDRSESWQYPDRLYRITKRRLQGLIIVLDFMKKYRDMDFESMLLKSQQIMAQNMEAMSPAK